MKSVLQALTLDQEGLSDFLFQSLNHEEPQVVYREKLVVVTIPFLVEDWKRFLFITRLIGSIVDTRETSTRQAKRVRGQQTKGYAFISLFRMK